MVWSWNTNKWYQNHNFFGRHKCINIPVLECGVKASYVYEWPLILCCAKLRKQYWPHGDIVKTGFKRSRHSSVELTIYTDSVAMTALATWADCWAVTGLREDLIGRQALFRAHVTHYTPSLLAGPRNHNVNHIKQVIKQSHRRWMIVRSKFTNCCFQWANTPSKTQKISIRDGIFSYYRQRGLYGDTLL